MVAGCLPRGDSTRVATVRECSFEGETFLARNELTDQLQHEASRRMAAASGRNGGSNYSPGGALGMEVHDTGMWIGSIMLFNVWVLIWPNQPEDPRTGPCKR